MHTMGKIGLLFADLAKEHFSAKRIKKFNSWKKE